MSEFIPQPLIQLYIIDFVEGRLEKEGDEQFRWVLITRNGEKVYKIRINGTIVAKYYSEGDKEKKSYANFTLDDGSDTIRVKAWEEQAEILRGFEVGEEVEVMGRPRQSDDEMYLLPDEILKIDDLNKSLYLRAKKIKRYAKKNYELPTEEQIVKAHDMAQMESVWSLIMETEEGVELEDIISKTKLDKAIVESVIQELIKKGDIYEPTSLKFRKI
ncbi:MAG: OB-fold nucleic acid binding domain-containing protein [Candidatus Heimdallarchaeaceae archaeon]|jgi:RPA family protein